MTGGWWLVGSHFIGDQWPRWRMRDTVLVFSTFFFLSWAWSVKCQYTQWIWSRTGAFDCNWPFQFCRCWQSNSVSMWLKIFAGHDAWHVERTLDSVSTSPCTTRIISLWDRVPPFSLLSLLLLMAHAILHHQQTLIFSRQKPYAMGFLKKIHVTHQLVSQIFSNP